MKFSFSWFTNLFNQPKVELEAWPFPAPRKPKVSKATTRKPAVKKEPKKVVKKKVIKVKK